MQIEPLRRVEGGEPPRERADRLSGLERHDIRQMGIVGNERGHRPLGDEDEPRVRVARPQHSHEGGGQQDVANRAEPDEEETRHAKKV